jgi:hypothetical protein
MRGFATARISRCNEELPRREAPLGIGLCWTVVSFAGSTGAISLAPRTRLRHLRAQPLFFRGSHAQTHVSRLMLRPGKTKKMNQWINTGI